jgi:hypothetical protein
MGLFIATACNASNLRRLLTWITYTYSFGTFDADITKREKAKEVCHENIHNQ